MSAIFSTRTLSYIHAALCLVLALFFINAGIKKFTPKALKPADPAILTEQIIMKESYAPPLGYALTMNTLRQSGFLKLIGVCQLLAAVLILIPRTRLAGLLLLLPIIFNIFFMHVFFDNRMHENVETGIVLGVNLLLLCFYRRTILNGLWNARTVH